MNIDKSSAKGVIAIVVIIVAVIVIYKFGLQRSPGTVPDRTPYICTNCGHEFEINTEDAQELRAENPDRTGEIKCANCKEFRAKKAIRCIYCEKYYLIEQSLEKFGEKYRCPHCDKTVGEE